MSQSHRSSSGRRPGTAAGSEQSAVRSGSRGSRVTVRSTRYGGPTTGRSTREAAERRKSADELKRAEPGSAPCRRRTHSPRRPSWLVCTDFSGRRRRVWLGQPRVHTGSAERLRSRTARMVLWIPAPSVVINGVTTAGRLQVKHGLSVAYKDLGGSRFQNNDTAAPTARRRSRQTGQRLPRTVLHRQRGGRWLAHPGRDLRQRAVRLSNDEHVPTGKLLGAHDLHALSALRMESVADRRGGAQGRDRRVGCAVSDGAGRADDP